MYQLRKPAQISFTKSLKSLRVKGFRESSSGFGSSGTTGGDGRNPVPSSGPKVPKSSASTATHPQPIESSSPVILPLSERSPGRQIPLDIAYPGVTSVDYQLVEKNSFETQMTTLDNGLRVATQPRYGKFCTVGIAVGAGSRYETNFPTGISHIVEKLGFMVKVPSSYKNNLSLCI